MITLQHKVAVYVPSTSNTNESATSLQADMIERVAREFSANYGGCTAESVTGYWLSDSVGLVKETPVRVWAHCAEYNVTDIVSLAERLKADMAQEAILIELDGVGSLV